MHGWRTIAPVLILGLVAAACGPPPPQDHGCRSAPAGYPEGPYGLEVGSTLCDVELSVQTGPFGPPAMKRLSDYRATPMLGALVLFGVAEWCETCKAAQPDLVSLFNRHAVSPPPGVAIIDLVALRLDGSPSDDQTLTSWGHTYLVPFDIARDPEGALAKVFDPVAFPSTLTIRLTDMKITAAWLGFIPGRMETEIQAALR